MHASLMASTYTARSRSAHWNIKGPQFAALPPLFAALPPLFETFAVGLALHDDTIERAVTLEATAYGTARHVAKASKLPEYPQDTTRDMEHVKLLTEVRLAMVVSLRERGSREMAQGRRR